ncbi:MAG: TolC family protein [Myxococcaceae bacterium]|nr:TolC family protein [Myxococcaceae bacterium]MCI0671999.1 TolC family protein [Myxococcaceae bacterium]
MTGLFVGLVLAATPISLDEVRVQSRENLQSLRAELEAQKAALGEQGARAGLLPQVSVGASMGGAWQGPTRSFNTVPDGQGGYVRQSVDTPAVDFRSFALSASVSQLLFDGARWAQLAQAGATSEAARGEAAEQRAASELEGVRRFYALFKAQRSLQVLEDNVRRSEDQVARARALFQAGRMPQTEVLAAEVNLGNDRISVLNQRAQVAGTQADLAAWLARSGLEELDAVDPKLPTEPAPAPSLEEAANRAKGQRALLVALNARVKAADALRTQALSQFLPRVYARGTYSRNGPEAGLVYSDLARQNELTGGLSLEWDLFNGFGHAAEADQAARTRAQAEAQLTQTEHELEAEVRKAHTSFQHQVEAAKVAGANRETAGRSLELTKQRFEAGASTTLEVRDAQFKLAQAELTLVQSRVDVEMARAALERAMGAMGGGNSP